MATIRDVAERAGVSTATVSRALNDRGYCSSGVRDRVRAAAESLGYVPNALARGLKTRRSLLIGLLVPGLTDPFFTDVAQGVESVASARGFQVLLGIGLRDQAREAAYLDLMLAHHVDGVLIAPAGDADAPVRRLVAAGTPTVVIDDVPDESLVDAVRADNVGGARQLANHLLALGHRRIALLNGRVASTSACERERGFRQAFADAGLPLDERLVRHGGWTTDDAAHRAADLLREPDRSTAIVAASAPLAAGTLLAMRAVGLRAPDDVALASFDDIPFAADLDPFLTVAAQPAAAMGRRAAAMLIERIAGDETGPPREVVMPVTLEVRRSCGAPAAPWLAVAPFEHSDAEVLVAG